MELFSFRFTSYALLLLCTFWSVTDCTATAPSSAPDVTPGSGTVTTQASTATATTQEATTPPVTTPKPVEDVKNVIVVGRTSTNITIEFEEVVGIPEYILYYGIDANENITGGDDTITYTVRNLSPAQKYNMTLRSKADDGRESAGFSFNASTAPSKAQEFKKYTENETSITLQWKNDNKEINYILRFGGTNLSLTGEDLGDPATHTVPELQTATRYTFTLVTVFDDITGEEVSIIAATAPSKAQEFKKVTENETSITLEWKNDNEEINYTLKFDGTEQSFTGKDLGDRATHTVTGLQDANRYTFTLVTVFDNIPGKEVSISAATAPSKAQEFKKVVENETSITLQWKNDNNKEINYILRFNGTELSFTGEDLGDRATHTVPGLQDATRYTFTLVTVFDDITGEEVSIIAATAPSKAQEFKKVTESETSITLQWKNDNKEINYTLRFHGTDLNFTGEELGDPATRIVPGLQNATRYNFTLVTVFDNILGEEINISAATAPPQVSSVEVTERTLNSITLEWPSVRNDLVGYLVENNIHPPEMLSPQEGLISYTLSSLKPGSLYTFSIYSVFKPPALEPVKSRVSVTTTVTVIDCSIVNWKVTETTIQGAVNGLFTTATATNGTQQHDNSGSGSEIKFTDLYPGDIYNMTLMYGRLEQCTHSLTIVPPSLEAKCKNWNGGYSIYIEWDSPSGVWDSVEVNVSGKKHELPNNGVPHAVLPNFQPAKKYEVSISSQSGTVKSSAYVFTCATDDRGVIAGAFFGVLFFILLVCAVVFLMRRRRPDIIRWKKSGKGGARTLVGKTKVIPLAKFPAHFNELSADENKGFSLEYEDLALVGTEQSQKAATMQENRPKNRFVNVLPYDWSRVKLTSHNDYINASYMPGYNSNKEFIAAQGPMPSTVNDFWKMIWEQKARGIVMVTNCTEGGRTKCEQYWNDSGPRVCGDLAVFTTSEQKQTDWTLREFKVKNRPTSEERTVKHFHFTAWPDHGVPQGTEVLIQFRALVRRHIQTEASGTPTVVHCSAGVGRTGTIIALDMLLQQLEKEKAVDINGFVQKMRVNRPHMVQTESQYVFLHQCILDSLQLNDTREENIYENELIYANATALREYQNNKA